MVFHFIEIQEIVKTWFTSLFAAASPDLVSDPRSDFFHYLHM